MPLLDLGNENVVGTSLETMIQQEIIDEAMAKLDIEKEFKKQNEEEIAIKKAEENLKESIEKMQKEKNKELLNDIYGHNYKVLKYYYETIWETYDRKDKRAESAQNLSKILNDEFIKRLDNNNFKLNLGKVNNAALQLINWLSLGTLGGLNKLVLEIGKASGAKPFVGESNYQILDSTARLHIFKNLKEQRRIAILESDLYHVLVKLYINIDNDNMKDLLLNKDKKLEKKIEELRRKIPEEYISSRTFDFTAFLAAADKFRVGGSSTFEQALGDQTSSSQTSSNQTSSDELYFNFRKGEDGENLYNNLLTNPNRIYSDENNDTYWFKMSEESKYLEINPGNNSSNTGSANPGNNSSNTGNNNPNLKPNTNSNFNFNLGGGRRKTLKQRKNSHKKKISGKRKSHKKRKKSHKKNK
jgi:hypothetical protein